MYGHEGAGKGPHWSRAYGPGSQGPVPSTPTLLCILQEKMLRTAVPAETRQPVQARGHSGNPKDCIQAWAPNPKTSNWKQQSKQASKQTKNSKGEKPRVFSVALRN